MLMYGINSLKTWMGIYPIQIWKTGSRNTRTRGVLELVHF